MGASILVRDGGGIDFALAIGLRFPIAYAYPGGQKKMKSNVPGWIAGLNPLCNDMPDSLVMFRLWGKKRY